ncbi:UNKNOWN [Stylonychia lemnae]|uniref:Uncharacterized protein n=1 Tax=Stylonychia lemnae TaxID=5949 RepID=A0A078AN86_STYLE|nr:UNKNOWN [Stylonychia lemnae]|eukprot:CDW82383.1 UNKNOWN [Stylonychia lemnae]
MILKSTIHLDITKNYLRRTVSRENQLIIIISSKKTYSSLNKNFPPSQQPFLPQNQFFLPLMNQRKLFLLTYRYLQERKERNRKRNRRRTKNQEKTSLQKIGNKKNSKTRKT